MTSDGPGCDIAPCCRGGHRGPSSGSWSPSWGRWRPAPSRPRWRRRAVGWCRPSRDGSGRPRRAAKHPLPRGRPTAPEIEAALTRLRQEAEGSRRREATIRAALERARGGRRWSPTRRERSSSSPARRRRRPGARIPRHHGKTPATTARRSGLGRAAAGPLSRRSRGRGGDARGRTGASRGRHRLSGAHRDGS